MVTAWPWPYPASYKQAASHVPQLTVKMNRADPFSERDATGWQFIDLHSGNVDVEYSLTDNSPHAAAIPTAIGTFIKRAGGSIRKDTVGTRRRHPGIGGPRPREVSPGRACAYWAQEADMSNSMDMQGTTVRDYDSLNYVATDAMPRDQTQSRRLHEPEQLITTIDPITGRDIEDLTGRPYLVDGNVVMYFESRETRQAYLDTPIDHPLRLPDNPTEEWVAEG